MRGQGFQGLVLFFESGSDAPQEQRCTYSSVQSIYLPKCPSRLRLGIGVRM